MCYPCGHLASSVRMCCSFCVQQLGAVHTLLWNGFLASPLILHPSQEGIQGGSTETVVLSKSAAAGAAGQNGSAAQPAAGPGAGSSGGRGGSSGEDTIIIPGAKARPLAGTGPAGSSGGQQQRQQQQHTGSLAELYANRTSQTFSSSSTGTAGGSQETTVALRHTPNAGAQLEKWFHAQASGVSLAVGAWCRRASIAALVLWREGKFLRGAEVVGRRHFIQRPWTPVINPNPTAPLQG